MCPTIQWLQFVRQIQEYQLPQPQQLQLQQQHQPCHVPVIGLSSREVATSSMGKLLRRGPTLMPFALLMGLDLHLFTRMRKMRFLMILPMEIIIGLEAIRRIAHGSGLTLQALTMIVTTTTAQVNAFFKLVVAMDRAGQVLIAVAQVMNITLFVSK